MIKKKSLFISSLILLIVSACSPIYRPTVINTPLLHEKDQVQFSAHTGINGNDFQGAYSPVDNIGILVNYSRVNNEESDTANYYSHYLFEGALGAYTSFEDSLVVLEGYVGYGQGASENYNDYWTNNYSLKEGKYRKIFFQPSLGLTSEVADVALSSRVVWVNYYDISPLNQKVGDPILFREYDLFLEPAVTFRIGYKYVKLMLQMGLSLPMSELSYGYNPGMLSFGLHFNLDSKYR